MTLDNHSLGNKYTLKLLTALYQRV